MSGVEDIGGKGKIGKEKAASSRMNRGHGYEMTRLPLLLLLSF